jgi:hypothetical protein
VETHRFISAASSETHETAVSLYLPVLKQLVDESFNWNEIAMFSSGEDAHESGNSVP